MSIKGIQKTSLVDFPGRICSVVFFSGCNLRCKFCHNPGLVVNNSDESLDADSVLKILKNRSSLIDGVVITGGEPVLSDSLEPFLFNIKEIPLKIKIDTNGLNPNRIESLQRKDLLDYIAIDVKTSPEKYESLTGMPVDFADIRATIDVARETKTDYEIRTTCVPGFVGLDDFKSIKKEIGIVEKYFLQQFVNTVEMIDPSFSSRIPYDKSILYEFRDFVKTFAGICEIRGI